VLVVCTARWIGGKCWFEQCVVDGFAVALDVQLEARGRSGEGEPGDARLPVLYLRAQLQCHAAASPFRRLRFRSER
jgi:hypothetical protein